MALDIELKAKIDDYRSQGETYSGIAAAAGVSPALIWKIARGICSSNKVRAYFSLALKPVEVVPCRGCGEVHTTKTCPNPKDKGRYRLALEFDTAEEWRIARNLIGWLGNNRKEQSKALIMLIEQENECQAARHFLNILEQ